MLDTYYYYFILYFLIFLLFRFYSSLKLVCANMFTVAVRYVCFIFHVFLQCTEFQQPGSMPIRHSNKKKHTLTFYYCAQIICSAFFTLGNILYQVHLSIDDFFFDHFVLLICAFCVNLNACHFLMVFFSKLKFYGEKKRKRRNVKIQTFSMVCSW